MPNTHSTLAALFSDIADAIRAKTGESGTIIADDFPTAISEIETGGQQGTICDYQSLGKQIAGSSGSMATGVQTREFNVKRHQDASYYLTSFTVDGENTSTPVCLLTVLLSASGNIIAQFGDNATASFVSVSNSEIRLSVTFTAPTGSKAGDISISIISGFLTDEKYDIKINRTQSLTEDTWTATPYDFDSITLGNDNIIASSVDPIGGVSFFEVVNIELPGDCVVVHLFDPEAEAALQYLTVIVEPDGTIHKD